MPNKTSVPTTAEFDQTAEQPLDAFAREFGQSAGKRVGDAIAQEIHTNPDARRAAAYGTGVGVGVVVGLGLLALVMD